MTYKATLYHLHEWSWAYLWTHHGLKFYYIHRHIKILVVYFAKLKRRRKKRKKKNAEEEEREREREWGRRGGGEAEARRVGEEENETSIKGREHPCILGNAPWGEQPLRFFFFRLREKKCYLLVITTHSYAPNRTNLW